MKMHGTMKINGQGHLEIGGCDTVKLIQEFGSPLYVMDEAAIRDVCRQYYQAFIARHGAEVIYASKAFMTMAMCRIIQEEGLGLDVVSGGELYTALKAGFPMDRIYFHGNNKTPEELELALKSGTGRIVVDNLYELNLINALAGEQGVRPRILLRITPGIEAHTHEYIQTGQIDSKFGLVMSNGQAMEGIKEALTRPNVELAGVHCHIGSQIFEMESYQHAARVMMEFIAEIKQETGVEIKELNLGGGFGIYYFGNDEPGSIDNYAELVFSTVKQEAQRLGLSVPRITVEPGRSIVGNAGTTLYTIGSVKHIPGVRTYVAVDGGMTDNPRPALYQAQYEALLANRANEQEQEVVSVAGKCCESGDMLIWDIQLPEVHSGDILAVACTGAYNYSMSSNYNRLARPAVVLVNEGRGDVIVKRENGEDLTRNDVVPARLTGKKSDEACA
ncbi:MAG TPA: diaminopimelate decarboxylase [Bacillota bacterium]|nr:diaminopimelate decarboxylase [Bacillota bacterium]